MTTAKLSNMVKTNRSAWRIYYLIFLVLASCCGALQAAVTPATGVLTYTLPQGATTSFGVPLMDDSVFSGACATATGNTIVTAGGGWTLDQFAQSAAPYFVAILTGGQTGRILLISANTANTLTVAVDDTNLDAAGFAMKSGDRFEIFRGDTLASLFGDTESNLLLLGGSPFTADTVQIHNGVRYIAYYFDVSRGFWVKVNGDGTNQNDFVLYPDRGLLIARRGPDTTFTLEGRAPATKLLTRLPGGTTNAISVRFPRETILGSLNFSGPGTWIADDSPFIADTINLFNGIRWVAYWKRATDGQWRQLNGDGTDQSGKVIPAGASILIQKRGVASGPAAFFGQDAPYTAE